MGKKVYVDGSWLFRGVDVSALLEGTQGMSPQLIRDERKNQPLPANLRPNLSGLSVQAQIARLLAVHEVWSYQRAHTDDHSDVVCHARRVARIYADLRAAGYLLDVVTGLRPKHAEAWLGILRSRGYAIDTIRSKWSMLRKWCNPLGKPNIVGGIEQYWSDAPKVERTLKRTAAQRHEQAHGDRRVHALLLRAKDRTHWYIEQLCTRLHLTVNEAVRFSPGVAGDYAAGHMKVRSGRGDAFRVIPFSAESDRMLVQEVIEFIFSENRKSLAWPQMAPSEAQRKHQQRITYLRRKLARQGDTDASAEETASGASRAEGARDAVSATSRVSDEVTA